MLRHPPKWSDGHAYTHSHVHIHIPTHTSHTHTHTFTYIHIPAYVIYTHMRRLYDRFTGECVWECEDCEGSGTHLWTAPPHHCGVFNGSGVWVVRAKKVADHAHFLAQSLFPITTNADEVCVCVCVVRQLCAVIALSPSPRPPPGTISPTGDSWQQSSAVCGECTYWLQSTLWRQPTSHPG